MTKIDDGGPAFPSQAYGGDGLPMAANEYGISVRDWFAAHALSGSLASVDENDIKAFGDMTMTDRAKMFAHYAYLMADAMISARKNSND